MNLPLNIDWQQILLHMFNFVILATGLFFLLFKPVKKFLAERKKHFEDMENALAEKDKKAAELAEEYDKRLSSAKEEIAEMKAAAAEEGAAAAQGHIDAAKLKADKIIADAVSEAEHEKERIVQQAQKEIADIVVEATEKLIAENSSPEHDKALYDQFIAAGKGNEN